MVPCDFSVGMLQVGKRNLPHLPFTAGDGTQLPFADATFDAVTISFGLRNIVDPDAGLREMLRVTRPGGRLVVCEFSSPTWSPFRTVYLEYLMKALPSLARAVSSSPGRLRLPRRVDPGLARPGSAWPARIEAAGWGHPSGATSPAGSWRCTAPTASTPLADAARSSADNSRVASDPALSLMLGSNRPAAGTAPAQIANMNVR